MPGHYITYLRDSKRVELTTIAGDTFIASTAAELWQLLRSLSGDNVAIPCARRPVVEVTPLGVEASARQRELAAIEAHVAVNGVTRRLSQSQSDSVLLPLSIEDF